MDSIRNYDTSETENDFDTDYSASCMVKNFLRFLKIFEDLH